MDFVIDLPKTMRGYDTIWVIVDCLNKSAHFLPIEKTYPLNRFSKIYIKKIVKLHSVTSSIVSDRQPCFTSHFWGALHDVLGSQLKFSTTFHLQTDRQSERTIRTLEDMLTACVLDFQGSWDEHLPLVEFTYNNSFHSSIGMLLYEILYRRPVDRRYVGKKLVIGLSQVLKLLSRHKKRFKLSKLE